LQGVERILDPEHAAHGKEQLIVVSHLSVPVLVVFFELLADIPYVDAAHRAARTGRVAQQAFLGHPFAGDAASVRIVRGLQVAPGQAFEFIQGGHVHGRPQSVVLVHDFGGGELFVKLLEQLGIFLVVG